MHRGVTGRLPAGARTLPVDRPDREALAAVLEGNGAFPPCSINGLPGGRGRIRP